MIETYCCKVVKPAFNLPSRWEARDMCFSDEFESLWWQGEPETLEPEELDEVVKSWKENQTINLE